MNNNDKNQSHCLNSLEQGKKTEGLFWKLLQILVEIYPFESNFSSPNPKARFLQSVLDYPNFIWFISNFYNPRDFV